MNDADIRHLLALDEPMSPLPAELVVRVRRRAAAERRRRAGLAGAAGLALVAGVGLTVSSFTGGPDTLSPNPGQLASAPPASTPSPAQPEALPTAPDQVATPMPDAVWDVVVQQAPASPAGPKPVQTEALQGVEQTFGTWQPTRPLYTTGGGVPGELPLYSVSGETLVAPGADTPYPDFLLSPDLDHRESVSQGWHPAADVIVFDRRPSYYTIRVVQDGVALSFFTQALESTEPVEEMRAWAQRVSIELGD